jgi:heme exporter protein CcmD
MQEFLRMGGYAQWVWPVYGIAAAALIGILVWTRATLQAREREFEALKATRGSEP